MQNRESTASNHPPPPPKEGQPGTVAPLGAHTSRDISPTHNGNKQQTTSVRLHLLVAFTLATERYLQLKPPAATTPVNMHHCAEQRYPDAPIRNHAITPPQRWERQQM